MEINFDPDEGPFTVDKIAEYEWPLDRKGETFMIQEQISQYLGVKSFKRKYPDLKRRVVDMEERNYLRENGLVSESMCDMGKYKHFKRSSYTIANNIRKYEHFTTFLLPHRINCGM